MSQDAWNRWGAYARMCRVGGGTADVMKQIIENLLLPMVRNVV